MKEVIGNRVVGFIGHGPSLSEFKDKVELFKGKDICWVSLNQVQIARDILSLIGEDLDIILGYASGYENSFKDEKCYVDRNSKGRGNSLHEFLCQCEEMGIPLVFCVGCDGYSDGDAAYYGGSADRIRKMRHLQDTLEFNKSFKQGKTRVVNVNFNSKYCLEKVSYDTLFTLLPKGDVRFSLLIPTRDRILLLCNLLNTINVLTKHKLFVEVLIAVDDDDYFTRILLDQIKEQTGMDIKHFVFPRSGNLHWYYNQLFIRSRGKYVICLNDDSVFETKNWDERTWTQLEDYVKPDGCVYGWVNDRMTSRPSHGRFCCFPVVSRVLHDKVREIQDERFNCGGADIIQYNIYERLNRIKRIEEVVISHLSPHSGNREADATNMRIKTMESTTEVIVHNKYGDGVFQPAEKYFDAAKELGVL
jgi:hypothetical protein